jgi:hypothetical protein
MARYQHTRRGDVETVPAELEERYDADPNWERYDNESAEQPTPKTTARKKAAKKSTAKPAADQ